MEAITTLEREHRVMGEVVTACRRELDRAGHGNVVDAAQIERFVEFFRFYTHSCHDPKEEGLLFSMLHRRGMAWDEEPLRGLSREHGILRDTLTSITGWVPKARRGDQSAVEPLRHELDAYLDLIEEHMAREERSVFVEALTRLSETDQGELSQAFANIACDEDDEGALEYYRELAHQLSRYSA